MQKDLPVDVPIELTEREREILKLLATGTSNKEIARELVISSNTVKVHLRNIFAKIGVTSRTEAAMYAVHSGLVKTAQNEAVEAPATEQPPKTRILLNTGAVLLLLVIVTGIAIFLVRQRSNQPSAILSPTSTPESRWKILADLPTTRTGMAVAAFSNQLYAIGGENEQGVSSSVERYDLSNNTWTELPPKPTAVTDISAGVMGGKIYIPGGRRSTGDFSSALEIYDPQNNTWSQGKNMPVAMSGYAMAAFEGRLYLFGGWDGKRYLDSVLVYDPGQDEWNTSVSMPTALGFAGAAVCGDKIYVMGGYDGKQPLDLNQVFSPYQEKTKDAWSQAEPMSVGRYDFGIAVMADSIYILGGKVEKTDFPASIVYLPQINKWEEFETPPIPIGSGIGLLPVGEYLYAIGDKPTEGSSGYTLSYKAIYTILFPIVK